MQAGEETEQTFREEWEQYKKERNEKLHRFFRKALMVLAVIGLTMSATVAYVYTTTRKNQDALCALRSDAERRVILGDKFFKDNPNGILGISVKDLKRSLANSKQTVDSLSNLDCPSIPEEQKQ